MFYINECDKNILLNGNITNAILVLYSISKHIRENCPNYLNKDGYVNILNVLNYCGINMQDCYLNSSQDIFTNEISGYLDVNDYLQNKNKWKIYINTDIGGLERRYVLAQTIAFYIIDNICDKKIRRLCSFPVFTNNNYQLYSDMLASFLLMPFPEVLKYFNDFRNERKDMPLKVEFIKFLSYKFLITDLQAAISFEHIRYLVGILYNEEDKIEFVNEKQLLKQYNVLFR